MFCLVRYLSNPLPQRDNNCITRKIVHEKYRHFNQLTPQDPWTTRILIQTPRYEISHKRTWDRTQVSYTRTFGKPWLRNMGRVAEPEPPKSRAAPQPWIWGTLSQLLTRKEMGKALQVTYQTISLSRRPLEKYGGTTVQECGTDFSVRFITVHLSSSAQFWRIEFIR